MTLRVLVESKDDAIRLLSHLFQNIGSLLVSEFFPISLVCCQYKIIAKLLAQRLKSVIPGLVSKCQSAFVSGRQILDGVLVVNEVLNWAKQQKKSLLLFKIYFAKAYDCISYDFLDSVLQQMYFEVKWQGLGLHFFRQCLHLDE